MCLRCDIDREHGGQAVVAFVVQQDAAAIGAALAMKDFNTAGTIHLLLDISEVEAGFSTFGFEMDANASPQWRVADDFQALHGVINNAGITRDGLLVKAKDGKVVKPIGSLRIDEGDVIVVFAMADDVPGVFVDPTIQTLYDDLVEQGSKSLVDALVVGATIEDMDIVDLQLRRSGIEAIDDVYANLEKGSRNHLRSFVKLIEDAGATYEPHHLTQEEFDEIVNSPMETGKGKRQGSRARVQGKGQCLAFGQGPGQGRARDSRRRAGRGRRPVWPSGARPRPGRTARRGDAPRTRCRTRRPPR